MEKKKKWTPKQQWIAWLLVVLILVGAGTVLVSGPFRGPRIQRHEAQERTLTYMGFYQEIRPKYLTAEAVHLYFNEVETYLLLDGSCLSLTLEEKLWALRENTPVTVLVHPDGLSVMYMEVDGKVLLEFEDAQSQMRRDLWFEAGLGLLAYGMATVLIVGKLKKKK